MNGTTEEGNDIKLTNHELFLLTAAKFIFQNNCPFFFHIQTRLLSVPHATNLLSLLEQQLLITIF
jgi:hypothetical protein